MEGHERDMSLHKSKIALLTSVGAHFSGGMLILILPSEMTGWVNELR